MNLSLLKRGDRCRFLPTIASLNSLKNLSLFLIGISVGFIASPSLFAQVSAQFNEIQEAIDAGEFVSAKKMASQLPQNEADRWLGKIAKKQFVGNENAATSTLREIKRDQVRSKTLANLFRSQFQDGGSADQSAGGAGVPDSGFPNNGFGGNPRFPGGRGGISINDYQPLINLIQSTIDPGGWDTTNGDGTLSPYIAGVLVDSQGYMKKVDVQRNPNLQEIRESSQFNRRARGNRSVHLEAGLRKISLTRLEREAQLLASMGKKLPEEMRYLAGMTEIQYLMFFPDTNDIVIAGPAGDWAEGKDRQIVNPKSGHPVLHLDDLVVCLRNAFHDNGRFGCTINPRQQNMLATKRFSETSKLTGAAWRKALRDRLGRQDVEVFGIDPRTHTGRVIVEADYRMKLLGMGLEPTIADVPSYLDRVQPDANGQLPPMDVVRWWFTLNYSGLTSDPDQTTFRFQGSGVQVKSETEMLDQQGNRIHTGTSVGPTKGFATDFTKHYLKLADQYPIYRQLKNVFDMAMVSGLIRQQQIQKSADWNLTYFGKAKSSGDFVYQPTLAYAPQEVDSVVNHRTIRFKRGSKRFKTTLVGVSGGVQFQSTRFLSSTKPVVNMEMKETNSFSKPIKLGETHWWWD